MRARRVIPSLVPVVFCIASAVHAEGDAVQDESACSGLFEQNTEVWRKVGQALLTVDQLEREILQYGDAASPALHVALLNAQLELARAESLRDRQLDRQLVETCRSGVAR